MFKEVGSKVDFLALERDILAWWRDNDIMAKYLKQNDGSDKRFSFIDGPITANNPMGVHHAWGRTYKDLFLRYRTMQGFRQRYQNGFDGQGLWIEVEVEKELGFKSKRDIDAFGIDKFVDLCKERVRKFSDTITQQSIRLGQWMDWDNSYHTMSDENNYTIWHFLKICHERGWLYEGRDVMPWCPRCGTGLSEHEIVTEGYREIVHPGLFVRLPLLGDGDGVPVSAPSSARQGDNSEPAESLLVWTTTPWTLTSNVAAAVHPDRTYVRVKLGDEVLYLMKSRLSLLGGGFEVLKEMPGRDLVGLRYAGPFDELPPQQGVEHRVIPWDDVTEDEGTGVVHIAPGAGKEDFALGKEHDLATIAPLDELGDFVPGFDWLTGQNVYDVNESIYASLREKGVLFRLEDYSHRYPVCWRCQSQLVFRLVDEWFISMDELRGLIAKVTGNIRWIPEFGLERELDWLRNMDDWMISKKRYWGLALPIYKCDCGHFDVAGSEEELEQMAVEGWDAFKGHSPHRPWIDEVKIKCSSCGAKVSRIRDVGNPWLDAGIVSFSTLGYRGDRDHWQEWFPADWISESFPGQFRNWFYSLLTMSTALENSEPCRTVFSYALMRDQQGEEMHKSRGNAIWFEDAAEEMGVDAMRWLFCRHNPAANLSFGHGSVDEVRRRFLIPLWNVYSFFVTYANIDKYDPSTQAPEIGRRPDLDRWIISELNTLNAEVTDALDNFDPGRATRAVEQFVEYLSNWYVRQSRRRFWKSGVLSGEDAAADEDKLCAYATLYECLTTLTRLLAPFMPFVTESLFQNLVRPGSNGVESVHLDTFPVPDQSKIDRRLSEVTRLAMRLSSIGRAARSKAGIKVRQPLAEAVVSVPTEAERGYIREISGQLENELNVRSIKDASQVGGVMTFDVRPNLRVLGPKYGSDVAEITRMLAAVDASEVALDVESGNQIELAGFSLLPEELLVTQTLLERYASSSEAGYTVAITTDITPELALEGLARELVHRVQDMRRSAGFDIADHIVTYYQGSPALDEVVAAHGDYVRQETLSRELISGPALPEAYSETQNFDGNEVVLAVKKEE